jgi:hypothetical protein
MPSTPQSPRRAIDPSDPHYPRPDWFRAIRTVLEVLWIVGIVGYAGNAIWSVIGVFTNGGDVTPQAIFDALLVGRLYTLAGTNPLAAGGIALGIVALTLLAYLARRDSLREKAVLAARAEYEKQAAYYTLKPVRAIDPVRDGIQLARYVPDVYLPRRESTGADADAAARATLTNALAAAAATAATTTTPDAPLGLLVTGRPTLGKTRFAWEALRDTLPDALFVNWPHAGAPDFDFTFTAGKTVALWLDNLQEYANDREAPALNGLPARFSGSGARLIVVATSRDGSALKDVTDKLAPLFRRLITLPLADITPAETDTLAAQLEREGQTVDRGAADGTPGALLLDVTAMRDQRYPALPDGARAVLKAMTLLRSAGTYDYPARRVGAVARGVFTLAAGRGAWDAAVDALVQSDFVRQGRAVDEDGLRALEPVADVYLERALRDYPAAGAAITDQWPALQDALTRERDNAALFDLGYSLAKLHSGLDGAAPYDLRSARVRAEQCFRAVLALLPPDDPDRLGAQNNLGNALRGQAEQASSDEERRRLLADAVAASTAARDAATPGTADWAGRQNNLGNALSDQAEQATSDEERRRLLADAVAAYTAALDAATPGTPGTADWADAQYNLALALVGRANLAVSEGTPAQACPDLREALHAMRSAAEVYREARPMDVPDAIELRQVIEQALNELGCPPE